MGLLTKQRIVDIPPPIQERREWQEHIEKVEKFAEKVELLTASAATLDEQRRVVAAELSEAQVQSALGEDEGAVEQATTANRRLAQIEKQLQAAQEQVAVQQEALRRLKARGPELQARLERQIADEVSEAYRGLTTELAEKLREIQPIATQLGRLRFRHGNSAALREAVWLDPDLVPRVGDGGLQNRFALWADDARKMGIEL